MRTHIIGCGNLDRGDDGAGVLVARRLRALGIEAEEQTGEAFSLMDSWNGCEQVIVIDAICSDRVPGEVMIWDASANPFPKAAAQCSTHGFGLYEAVELGRSLDRLPAKLLIYGIEGRQFAQGARPLVEVEKSAEVVAEQVARFVGTGSRLS